MTIIEIKILAEFFASDGSDEAFKKFQQKMKESLGLDYVNTDSLRPDEQYFAE